MNIDDKQRLWSKYYLIQSSDINDNIFSLKEFVSNEVKTMKLPEKTIRAKERKVIKYMLKYMSKKDILRKYCNMVQRKQYSSKSKNEIIDQLVRFFER